MKKIIPIAGLVLAQITAAAEKPNIIIILADDLGYGELGCYGAKSIHTPNLDALASRGVKFTSFYANAPECTPTRAALLSGRYQHVIGGLECALGAGNVGRYDEAVWLAEKNELGMPPEFSTLARELKGAGYATANIGKWHLGYEDKFSPPNQFFDYSIGPLGYGGDQFYHVEQDSIGLQGFTGNHTLAQNGKETFRNGYYSTHLFTDEAKSWLNRQKKDIPFFLYLAYTVPHTPHQGPADFTGKPLKAEDFNRPNKESYVSMVEELDRCVGDLMEMLRRKNFDDNTLVVFFSDNGAMRTFDNGVLRGHKGQLFEGGIRVPCIMRWPGKIKPGIVSDQVVMGFDITFSALTLAGVNTQGLKLDGFDIINHLAQGREDTDRLLFWRIKRGAGVSKAVREGEMKFIVVYSNGTETERYLFNLENDVSETTNLVEQFPRLAGKLFAKLTKWEERVAAPRLNDFSAVYNP
jgi:N-acetylgalactosamine-6-sulfatase